ncbi:Glutamate receptor ionotropic kainate 2 [Fasciola gigantica]|uniref:Glutamate receptor ionotropic kainate 2 n=1 Tax=Fasciola gigantica TaxID=46835 RepID=A0A504YLN5_FASGI|nr:Glutamate receptor ionotropic kainate 2 [Fasciola gigantica]
MLPSGWTTIIFVLFELLLKHSHAQIRSYETIELSVGAIIDKNDVAQEICFKKSVQEANKLLQKHEPNRRRVHLVPLVETIDGDDSFEASQKACRLLERQVVAIYGPSTPNAVDTVQSLATQFGIPHLQIDWGFRQKIHGFALNVHPHYLAYGQALYDYVRAAEWPSVALIYYREESKFPRLICLVFRFSNRLIIIFRSPPHLLCSSIISALNEPTRPSDLLKYDYLIRTMDTSVRIRKWDVASDNHRYVIKQFSKMQQQYAHFIVDIPFWEIQEFLNLIQTYNMTTQFYRYIFTDWDIQLVDPEAFRAVGAANITTISILEPLAEDKGYGIGALLDDVRMAALQDERFTRSSTSRRISPTYSALLYDGLSLLAMGILSSSRTSDLLPPSGLTCSASRSWNPGINLINDIKAIKPENFRGLTGTFQFDGYGWRSDVNFTILEFAMSEFRKEKPYMMYIGNTPPGKPKSTDPKDWQGFCIDLLNYISRDLNFSYTINLVPDSTYGNSKIIDGEEVWDGMVKELSLHKADLAVGSFTITYDRDRVIDFTTPFMYLGISIIYRRPEDKESHLFSFLQPLSAPVSSDILPHATSTRIIAGFWWFFTLIVISSYTANLAAFLTVARMVSPIENVEDLSKQTKIKYGTIQGGSTEAFFAHSKFPIYERMYQFMTSQKGLLMNSTSQAIKRVKREEYAFLLESTMNEYYRQRDCDLMQVGGLLDSKGYGIGLPSGSKYRDPISETILKLQKQQILENRRHFWWGQHDIKVRCDASTGKSSDTSSLGMEKVGGCFVMLLIGMGMSLLVSLLEFIYSSYQRVRSNKRSIHEEIARDFRFAMACSSMRSRKAEDAAVLPPPPALTCVPKDSAQPRGGLKAALAYAPCLSPPDLPMDLIAAAQFQNLRVSEPPSNGEQQRLQIAASQDCPNMITINTKGSENNSEPQFLPTSDGTQGGGLESSYQTGILYPRSSPGVASNDQLEDEDVQDEDEEEEEEVDGDVDEDEMDDEDDDGDAEEWLPGPSLESPGSVSAFGGTNRHGLPSHLNYPMRNTPGGGSVSGAVGGSVTSKQESQQPDGKIGIRGGNDVHLKKVSC